MAFVKVGSISEPPPGSVTEKPPGRAKTGNGMEEWLRFVATQRARVCPAQDVIEHV